MFYVYLISQVKNYNHNGKRKQGNKPASAWQIFLMNAK